jgi:hypothetical protein
MNTDTVDAKLTPGEGVLNIGAMSMPGMRQQVDAANAAGAPMAAAGGLPSWANILAGGPMRGYQEGTSAVPPIQTATTLPAMTPVGGPFTTLPGVAPVPGWMQSGGTPLVQGPRIVSGPTYPGGGGPPPWARGGGALPPGLARLMAAGRGPYAAGRADMAAARPGMMTPLARPYAGAPNVNNIVFPRNK